MDTSVSPQKPVCVCTSGFEGTTCGTGKTIKHYKC